MNIFKKVLNEINEVQLKTIYSVTEFRKNTKLGKGRGFYWIWTNLSFDELKKTEDSHIASVPIKKLVIEREELNNICNLQIDDFRVVYNGIGGYKGKDVNKKVSYDLRGRINQEFFSNDPRTGTLNLLNRKNLNIENWAVSFFEFNENQDILKLLNEPFKELSYYDKYANMLEGNWRIEFGQPILNRY